VFVPLLIATRVACPGDADRYLEMVDLAECYAFRVYRLIGRGADACEAMLTRLGCDLASWLKRRGIGGARKRASSPTRPLEVCN
jgi:hypothetical protein